MGESLNVREYLRVSKDSSGMGKSPDQQHDENIRAIEGQGWQLHSTPPYRDTDRSASRYAKREREDFVRLIADLEADAFDADVLALWESSRGSRRVGEWVKLVELCAERQVRIWVTTHGRLYDPVNARDRRSLLEDAVDAEYEAAKTAERIQRDVRASAAAGKPHGKNLYGYMRTYKQGPRGPMLDEILPHPEQAPVVQEAASRVMNGDTFYAIAKDFNKREILPRRPSFKAHRAHLGWTGAAVKQMLTVPAYAGKRVHLGEIVADAVWPPLIDFAIWQKLQPVISPSERKRTNDWPAVHLLSGIATCAVCGSGLRVGKQNLGRRKDKDGNALPKPVDEHGSELPYPTYRTYVCSGTPGKTGFHVAMKESTLDQLVTEVVLARLERPDFLAVVGAKQDGGDGIRQALLDEIEGHQDYLDDVRAKAAELQRFDLLLDQEKRIQPKIQAAQAKLEQLARLDPAVVLLVTGGAIREAWAGLDLPGRRRIIRAVVTPAIKRVGQGKQSRAEEVSRNFGRIEWAWR
ncbi:recombinase family protein [Rhodococcus sp. 008]|uniref:recombinase family protein n=1 Tax=Rhodococcus sp. 008 TaxID=1723645 RepID=UPI0018D44CC6|nr:recombinase family protein [Rhodococcus sp. 008]